MRLYGTITSERATKGQGGNNHLFIHITGKDRKNDIAVVSVFPWENYLDDDKPHICLNIRDDIKYSVDMFTKGKKQKGEN
jgi:hypothetical protein